MRSTSPNGPPMPPCHRLPPGSALTQQNCELHGGMCDAPAPTAVQATMKQGLPLAVPHRSPFTASAFFEGTNLSMCGDMLQLLRPLDRQEAVAGSSRYVLPQLGHSQAFLADVEPLQHACTARCNTQSPVKGFRGVGTGQQCLAYHETLAARLYGQEAHLAAGNWHNWHLLDCGASAGRLHSSKAHLTGPLSHR